MKKKVIALTLSFCVLSAFATCWPEYGFKYVQGVARTTFAFDKSSSPWGFDHFYERVYAGNPTVFVNGYDMCYALECSLARLHAATGTVRHQPCPVPIYAVTHNSVISNINASVRNEDGFLCWYSRGDGWSTHKQATTYGPPAPDAATGVEWAYFSYPNLVYQSFERLTDTTMASALVRAKESISTTKARIPWRAFYRMRYCAVEASDFEDVYPVYYGYIKEVDDLDTPADPALNKWLVYARKSELSVRGSYMAQSVSWAARWMTKQSFHGVLNGLSREVSLLTGRTGARSSDYVVLKVERGRRNWATGSFATETAYVFYKEAEWISPTASQISRILQIAGIVDDVSCPERSDDLKNKMAQSAAPGAVGVTWNDYVLITRLCGVALVEMEAPYFWLWSEKYNI